MAQSAEREVEHDPAVVNDPLELRGRRAAVASHELSQAADVNGIESPQLELWRLTQFVGSSSFQKHQSLGGIVGIQFDGCLNGWQPVDLQHRLRWLLFWRFSAIRLARAGFATRGWVQVGNNFKFPPGGRGPGC